MVRDYLKYDKVIEMLNDGWVIYTDNGFGGAPYTPLFFRLWDAKTEKINGGEIHRQTINKLIRNKIIHGTDRKHGKYSLISQPQTTN